MAGLTFFAYRVEDGLQDARNLLDRLRDEMPPALAEKLTMASDLVTEVENELGDREAGERGR